MASLQRAPKQWCLCKSETITSFESWRQNLIYTLSLDEYFTEFLREGFQWKKKSKTTTHRGLADDGEPIVKTKRRTAQQKASALELMLGQIANFCPIIARNTIVQKSTSLDCIWQTIRLHYGFHSTGAHLLDFAAIQLEPGEKPEDLFQRITAFVEDNLLRPKNILTQPQLHKFHATHVGHSEVFNSSTKYYNERSDPVKATMSTGPVQHTQYKGRLPQHIANHQSSETSKAPLGKLPTAPPLEVGGQVYLLADRNKTIAHNCYQVTDIDYPWCNAQEFRGNQLRNASHHVRPPECYSVPMPSTVNHPFDILEDDDVTPNLPPDLHPAVKVTTSRHLRKRRRLANLMTMF